MLDGLLGRGGFYSKCKSLIKLTRSRIDVIRRKRSATEKFLKKDIADLLVGGRETNAFGRVEGLIAELILTACYDFIDYVCEIILKQLSVMQKHNECPEDSKEAVASLMYAAARLSDLPELRDLRNIFQDRYGSSLECYVNKKLVENIASKPPSVEKKLQLMQDIASEFSIKWDPNGFEQRMSNPSASARECQKSQVPLQAVESKYVSHVEQVVQKPDKNHVFANRSNEVAYINKGTGREGIVQNTDELNHKFPNRQELISNRCKSPGCREETFQKMKGHHLPFMRKREIMVDGHHSLDHEITSRGMAEGGNPTSRNRLEPVNSDQKRDSNQNGTEPGRDGRGALSQRSESVHINGENAALYAGNNKDGKTYITDPMRKVYGEAADGLKSKFKGAIPPPYVKPRKSKHKAHLGSKHFEVDSIGGDGDISSYNDSTSFGKLRTGAGHLNNEKQDTAVEIVDGQGSFTAEYYKDDMTSRRRSSRRRHAKSGSIHEYKTNLEETRVVERISSSRRRGESKKGLQILFDDDPYQRSEEERMIDKLLLHYSHKPSTVERGNLRRKSKTESADVTVSSVVGSRNVDEGKVELVPPPSRSISLSCEQASSSEQKKEFTRAASFQQGMLTPAKHVHPKLPDYDDLAAQFAALRRNRDLKNGS
ncbi:hypothetical protein Ancab_028728 [Ancistrocladus abbreviatus]